MTITVIAPDIHDPVVDGTTIGAVGNVSRLKSDTPTLLMKWVVDDERKLREAMAHIEAAQQRRNMALQAVDEALSRAGVPADLRDALVQSATDIRAALAPFDLKAAQ